MKKICLVCFLFLCMLTISVYADPPREGYTLTFSDEFDGKKLNTDVWHYRNEGYRVHGGYNDPKMVSVSDGNLHIAFDKKAGDYRGGGVITNFGLGYGYYEVRSRLYGGTGGLHSSFWTAGVSGDGKSLPKFNRSIELDFYEVDSDEPTRISSNAHYWLGGHLGAPKNVVRTEDDQILCRNLTDASSDYFVMGCEYLPDRVIWYINGTVVCEAPELEMYGRPNVWLTALANTDLSGTIDNSKLPGESVWDYFRFYTMPFKGENLIVNPSFDDNNRADYITDISKMKLESPVSWLEPEYEENISVETQDQNIRTGTGALKINKKGTVAQNLTYIANGTYQLSFYVKCDAFTKLTAKVNEQELSYSTATGENFALVTLETVEITDNHAYISISADGDDAFYIDDVSFICFDGTDMFNRKTIIDPCEINKIPGEIGLYDVNGGDENITFTGEWKPSSIKGYMGNVSAYSNSKDATVHYKLIAQQDAEYAVQLYRMSYGSSCKDAKATVMTNGKEQMVRSINLNDTEAGFETLGIYPLKKGDTVTITLSRGTSGYLRADSARIVPAALLEAQNGLALKLECNKAYLNLSKRFIDPDNKNAAPYINGNDRTLIPLRFIAESLGATVSYSGQSGLLGGNDEIKIVLGDKTLLFATDVGQYAINGEIYALDAPPENKQARTYVPVRALAEAFGKKVYYSDGIILLTDEIVENESTLSALNKYLY